MPGWLASCLRGAVDLRPDAPRCFPAHQRRRRGSGRSARGVNPGARDTDRSRPPAAFAPSPRAYAPDAPSPRGRPAERPPAWASRTDRTTPDRDRRRRSDRIACTPSISSAPWFRAPREQNSAGVTEDQTFSLDTFWSGPEPCIARSGAALKDHRSVEATFPYRD